MLVERAGALDPHPPPMFRRGDAAKRAAVNKRCYARQKCGARIRAALRMGSERSRKRLARRRQEDMPSAGRPVDVKRGAGPLAKIR
jgi:hypothetical protein